MKGFLIALVTTVVGGLIVAYLVFVLGWGSGPSPGTSPPASDPDSDPVTFYVSGRRSQQQISGQATVTIDGEHAGVLRVDQSNPTDEISHTVPGSGTYSYTVEAVSVEQDAYGMVYELYGSGQGSIDVEQGSTFEIHGGAVSGNTYQVSLVED
jgi:hypothetical protein